jgi:CHAP domain
MRARAVGMILGRLGWMQIGALAGALGGGLLLLLLGSAVAVVLGAAVATCAPAPAQAAGSEAPSAAAVRQIPPERLAIYEQAASRYDIDWSFLASIGTQECGSGDCSGVNSSGCAGPMQIADVRGSACSPGSGPTLWERYAVDADPTKPLSVNDPADAIYTAARILKEDMGAPPQGASYQAYFQTACRYYGACSDATVAYASEVMQRAVEYGFTGPGAPANSSPAAQPAEAQPSTGCSSVIFTGGASGERRIVKIAESQVGQGEHPPGSNCTVYGPCEEWCSLFAAWVWQHAGIPLEGPTATYGYSGSLYTWTQDHGGKLLAAAATPAPGDLVFYGKGPSESDHVGIVVRVLADGSIETVEGNYNNKVTRVGPYPPAQATTAAGEPAAIYGYAQPPAARSSG